MKITPIKTKIITPKDMSLENILKISIKALKERSIVVVTSKIVSITESSIVPIGSVDKERLVKEMSEWYIPPSKSKYKFSLTVIQNTLIPTAGIDESNSGGYYVLWPKDAQKTANSIRFFLAKRFSLRFVGVLIIDSHTTPLRWGVTGISIAHSGFLALKQYIGTKDLFGRKYHATLQNICDGIAAGTSVVMGEGKEQTPIAIIEDLPFVKFQNRNPTEEELESLKIDINDDLYEPLLSHAPWEKGGARG